MTCFRCGAGPVSCAHRTYEPPAMMGADEREKQQRRDWSNDMSILRRRLSTPNHHGIRGRYR